MAEKLSNTERIRKLPWALAGDMTNVVYVYLAFSGPVFVLFLSRLELPLAKIGTLQALFPLTGLIAPFIAARVSRMGLRRVFLAMWTVRKFVLLLMVFAPWVFRTFGSDAAFWYVVAVTGTFAVLRMVAVTAMMPWMQELVPDAVRGKYSAMQNVALVLSGMVTTAAAGWYLGDEPLRERFIKLFCVAFVFGLVSVWFYSRLPRESGGGGETKRHADASAAAAGIATAEPDTEPDAEPVQEQANLEALAGTFKDRRFVTFLVAQALVSVGWSPMAAFLPLFLEKTVGLPVDRVVFLESVRMFAGLLSCFFWGWAADRYGGKPVMILNLVVLAAFPLSLLFLPHHHPMSFIVAASIYGVLGLALPGWAVGYYRVLFVNVIPGAKKTSYNAIHVAWSGLFAGVTPIVAGKLIDHFQGWTGDIGFMTLTPFTLLFLSGIVFLSLAVVVMAALRVEEGLSVQRFASMFVQGSPVAAVQALIAYQFGGTEDKRVEHMERLGATRSPLSVDELIEGLQDPSFNVRYEAVVSIARGRHDDRLVDALLDVLHGPQEDLSVAAAWALGRMEGRRAIPGLRDVLATGDGVLRSRAARSLAALNDSESAPAMLRVFQDESSRGVRLAYAAALGALRYRPALQPLLWFLDELLEDSDDDPASIEAQRHGPARAEVAMAITSIVGKEQRHVRLWRKVRRGPGEAFASYLLNLRRRLTRHDLTAGGLGALLDACVHAFGQEDLAGGTAKLREVIAALPLERMTLAAANVLQHEIGWLERDDHEPAIEPIMLCVHAVGVGFEEPASRQPEE